MGLDDIIHYPTAYSACYRTLACEVVEKERSHTICLGRLYEVAGKKAKHIVVDLIAYTNSAKYVSHTFKHSHALTSTFNAGLQLYVQ